MCNIGQRKFNVKTIQATRFVPPFSFSAAYQKHVKPYPRPKIDLFVQRKKKTLFRTLYLRGDLPCQRDFRKSNKKDGQYLQWKIPPQELDYDFYLPIFFDGLSEIDYPYNLTARYGIHDMLKHGRHKILNILPKLIMPLKLAFGTKNPSIIMAALKVIQHLLKCNRLIGKDLVPYYRQLLPSLHMFMGCNVHPKDGIDYDRVETVGDVIDQTLQMLERYGGPESSIHIKSILPTYGSTVNAL